MKRLAGGLSKLVDAARDVDRMSIELKDAQVIVSAKTVEVEALMEQITEKTTIANKCDLRVLKCCGAFTPSTRLVIMREGAGPLALELGLCVETSRRWRRVPPIRHRRDALAALMAHELYHTLRSRSDRFQ